MSHYVDGFCLNHLARHEVAAVRGGVEHDILRPSFDASLQHGLQRFVGCVVGIEGKVVAKNDEALRALAQMRKASGQAENVFAVDLDKLPPYKGRSLCFLPHRV